MSKKNTITTVLLIAGAGLAAWFLLKPKTTTYSLPPGYVPPGGNPQPGTAATVLAAGAVASTLYDDIFNSNSSVSGVTYDGDC